MIAKQIKEQVFFIFFISFFLFLTITFNIIYILQTPFILKLYTPSLKQTLQKIEESHFTSLNMNLRILKVKSNNTIWLEFLSKQEDNSYFFVNKLKLRGNREAYFNQEIKKDIPQSSLLIFDSDGNGELEIIAPTFNSFFLPYINIVFYNKETKKFELKK